MRSRVRADREGGVGGEDADVPAELPVGGFDDMARLCHRDGVDQELSARPRCSAARDKTL